MVIAARAWSCRGLDPQPPRIASAPSPDGVAPRLPALDGETPFPVRRGGPPAGPHPPGLALRLGPGVWVLPRRPYWTTGDHRCSSNRRRGARGGPVSERGALREGGAKWPHATIKISFYSVFDGIRSGRWVGHLPPAGPGDGWACPSGPRRAGLLSCRGWACPCGTPDSTILARSSAVRAF